MNWFPKLLALVVLVLILSNHKAISQPIAIANEQGITITLTDEPCTSQVVTNLPYRATWEEKGKKYEGCFNVNSGIVVAYFSDKTVAIMPGQIFRPATEL